MLVVCLLFPAESFTQPHAIAYNAKDTPRQSPKGSSTACTPNRIHGCQQEEQIRFHALYIGENPPWLKQKKQKSFHPLFPLASTPFCANRAQPQALHTPTPRGRLCGLPAVERGGAGGVELACASGGGCARGRVYVCARFLSFEF